LANKNKKSFFRWIYDHRKQLIIAGFSITVLILAVFTVKNRAVLEKLWADLKEAVAEITKNTEKNPAEKNTTSVITIKDRLDVKTPPNISKATLIDNTGITKLPFEVQKHIRNLHPGYHPSPEKIATASENGINLRPHQTWVKEYMKRLEGVG